VPQLCGCSKPSAEERHHTTAQVHQLQLHDAVQSTNFPRHSLLHLAGHPGELCRVGAVLEHAWLVFALRRLAVCRYQHNAPAAKPSPATQAREATGSKACNSRVWHMGGQDLQPLEHGLHDAVGCVA
jgi:hypothetical protein